MRLLTESVMGTTVEVVTDSVNPQLRHSLRPVAKTVYGCGVPAGESDRDYDVIPSLMDLLSVAVEDVKEKRGGVKKAHEAIGSHMEKSERQVRRYFEDDSGLTMDELDALVAAVAIESTGDRMGFWHGAIARVDGTITRLGLDPRKEAAEAASALPEESDPDSE